MEEPKFVEINAFSIFSLFKLMFTKKVANFGHLLKILKSNHCGKISEKRDFTILQLSETKLSVLDNDTHKKIKLPI